MLVLGFESSCDETGVAMVRYQGSDLPTLVSHALYSQIEMHQAFGGVVPELASRDHIRRVLPLTQEVLTDAGCTLDQVDVVAFTRGPGLAGALLVGAGVACALAAALVDGVGRYAILGETIDDAAGEAFDKSAKLMGLGYPGGPALSKLAEQGNGDAYKLPRPLLHSGNLDFSFAGLKTAVLVQAQRMAAAHATQGGALGHAAAITTANGSVADFERLPLAARCDLAASTQAAIVDVLVKKSMMALRQTGLQRLVVAGGVGANRSLRSQLNVECAKRNIRVHYPELHLCTDNGAMIAMAAAMRLQSGLERADKTYAFDVKPRWQLDNLPTAA